MRDLIWFFLSVGGVVLAVLCGVIWQGIRPQSRRARRYLLFVVVFYAALSTYGIWFGASRLLTVGLHPLVGSDVSSGRTAIVVLGSVGFIGRDWKEGTYSIVDRIDATRSVEAARAFRLVHADWVIASGGKSRLDDPSEEASGVTLRDALITLGVPSSQILIETESRSTRDEALIVAPMLRQLNIEQTVLVTSGDHMRRSLGTFRAVGIRAIPAIAVEPYTPASWIYWIVPSDLGLWKSTSVMHEVIGIAYYGVRGWYGFR